MARDDLPASRSPLDPGSWRDRVQAAIALAERWNLLPRILIGVVMLNYLTSNYLIMRYVYYFAVLPLALVSVRKEDVRRVASSPIFLLACGYFAVLTIASLFAPDARIGEIARHFRDSLLVLSFLFLLAHLSRKDEAFPVNLLWFMSTTAGLMAIVNLLYYFSGMLLTDDPESRLGGIAHVTPVMGRNELASLYGVGCVAAAAIAARGHLPRIARIVSVIAALALFLAMLLIQSRGALLSASCGLLVVLAFGGGATSRRLLVALCFVAVFGAFLLSGPILSSYLERGDTYRFLIWHEYFTEFVLKRPWLGHGISADQLVKTPGMNVPHAHNIVLHAWVKGGAFAALALLGLVVASLIAGLRSARRLGQSAPLALMTVATAATSIDYGIVASSLGYQWILLWLPVGLCLGASLRPPGGEERAKAG